MERKIFISGGSILTGDNVRSQKYCSIDENDIVSCLDGYQFRSLDRISRLTLAAASAALRNAGLGLKLEGKNDCGLILGSMYGALDSVHSFDMVSVEKGALAVNPTLFPNTVQNSPACQSGIQLLIAGPILTVCNGMRSGLDAIGLGYYHLKWGLVSTILAGGADEISELQMHMHKTNRPLYETGSFVVLESKTEGETHNAVAEVVGYNTHAFINSDMDEILKTSCDFAKMLLLSSGLSVNDLGGVHICADFDEDDSNRIMESICNHIQYSGLRQCMMEDRMSASGVYQTVSIYRNQDWRNERHRFNIIINICELGISALLLKSAIDNSKK